MGDRHTAAHPPATAGGTDRFQAQLLTFEAEPIRQARLLTARLRRLQAERQPFQKIRLTTTYEAKCFAEFASSLGCFEFSSVPISTNKAAAASSLVRQIISASASTFSSLESSSLDSDSSANSVASKAYSSNFFGSEFILSNTPGCSPSNC